MCCHRLPFESNSMKGLMQDICFKDVGTSDRRGKYFPLQYSDELWKLIIQLLQKNPADRPTVQEILQLPFIRRQMPNVMKILQTELDAMAVSTPRSKKNSPRHAPKTPKGAPPPPPPRGRVVAAESGMDGGSGPSAREDPSSMSPGLRAALAYYGEGQKADDLTEKNPTDRRGAASPKVDDKSAEKPSLKELLQLYDDQKKKVNKSDGNRKADPRGREEETEHRHSEAKPQRRADGYRGEPPVLSAAARQGNAPRFSKEEAAAQYSEETEEEEEEEGEECMEEDYANPETYQEDLKNVLQRLTVHMSVDEAPANDRKAPAKFRKASKNEDEPPLDIQKGHARA
ncbi:hypothetical protein AGDE_12497 [Angomonas deanei]|nr:hypothetical protein AGDE_12497 [Angomonas deanei]|eukprot:EPY24107.1 hypothetical protein AGDE_12497 [Angomonas deanei]